MTKIKFYITYLQASRIYHYDSGHYALCKVDAGWRTYRFIHGAPTPPRGKRLCKKCAKMSRSKP